MSAETVATGMAVSPRITGDPAGFTATIEETGGAGGRRIFRFRLHTDAPAPPPSLVIRWTLPAVNVKGVWTSGALYEKRLRADWEAADVVSRISVEAPVVSVFGHADENRITFAWSDATETTELAAPVREEDNLLHCSVTPLADRREPITEYTAFLSVDERDVPYYSALSDVGGWWETLLPFSPAPAPAHAQKPIYSTWYNYHQEVDPDMLLAECRLARELGYGTIIVDDGWQTMDNRRGYDFTGDWEAERFTEMRRFSDDVRALGMHPMIWYSVPFCGPKSKAYQRFRGKFLTEDHRWAPVFDPRYPEVRAHLVSKYRQALEEWNLDGLKLDFIDEFRTYPGTPTGAVGGRDIAGVNEAVRQLLAEITEALHAVKPDALIEFRQRYIGPELRRLGNLFRAFDCPNDSVTNRLRTTDVRLIAGSSLTTADMITWHPDEADEVAALQFTSILFSVPQLSVRLGEQPAGKLAMIRFWTAYYNDNREVLLGGEFAAEQPLAAYSQLSAGRFGRRIIGVYGGRPVRLGPPDTSVDIINGTLEEAIVVHAPGMPAANVEALDCRGARAARYRVEWTGTGYQVLSVPPSGLLRLRFSQ